MCRVRSDPKAEWSGGFYLELGGQVTTFLLYVSCYCLYQTFRDAAGWVAQIRDRIEIHEAGTPQFRLGLWRQAFSTEAYNSNFKPPEEKEWVYHVDASEEICVNRALSKSYISILPPDEKESVTEDIKAIVSRGDGKVWIDRSKGVFEYPYKTLVVLSRKK